MTCCGLLLQTRLFLASLGVWGRPWGVGAAGCYATMLGNDDSGLLCVLLRRVCSLIFGCLVVLFGYPFLYINSIVLIERQSFCHYFKKKKEQ